jgi:hypothetical protein
LIENIKQWIRNTPSEFQTLVKRFSSSDHVACVCDHNTALKLELQREKSRSRDNLEVEEVLEVMFFVIKEYNLLALLGRDGS